MNFLILISLYAMQLKVLISEEYFYQLENGNLSMLMHTLFTMHKRLHTLQLSSSHYQVSIFNFKVESTKYKHGLWYSNPHIIHLMTCYVFILLRWIPDSKHYYSNYKIHYTKLSFSFILSFKLLFTFKQSILYLFRSFLF